MNLIGTARIELLAKSLILRVYDVLARHTANSHSVNESRGNHHNLMVRKPVQKVQSEFQRETVQRVDCGDSLLFYMGAMSDATTAA
jgi:hypothetical protein